MRRFLRLLALFGLDLSQLGRALGGAAHFGSTYAELSRQYRSSEKEFPFGRWVPCLGDTGEASGTARGHYFHQDLLVAQWIYENRPARHVDVGSRVDGFVAHVATFCDVEVFDIRELSTSAARISFQRHDLTSDSFKLREYCDSLSCLHALEHFGLGRYGDPVDYYGYRRGWDSLYRLLRPGGKLYFSVPIGPQRIEFNGHRVFSVPYLLSMMEGRYRIDRFAYVDDQGELVLAHLDDELAEESCGCTLGCGIFELTKVEPSEDRAPER